MANPFLIPTQQKQNPFLVSTQQEQAYQSPEYSVGGFVQNAGRDAYDMAAGVVNAVRHPVDTVEGLGNLAQGAIHNIPGTRAVDQWAADNMGFPLAPQQQLDQEQAMASQVGQGIKTAAQHPLDTAYNNPVSTLMNVSMGAGLVGKGAKLANMAKAANVAEKVGSVTNPLSAAAPAIKAVGNGVGFGGNAGNAIVEALRAGQKGGDYKKAFSDNLRGAVSQEAVVGEAQKALSAMADKRKNAYVKNMQSVKGDPQPLDIGPIEEKFWEQFNSLTEGPVQKADDATMKKMDTVYGLIEDAKKNPTPAVLDALKQRIRNEMPSAIDSHGDQSRVLTSLGNAVKSEIIKQHPEYGKVMKDYETSKSLEDELTRSLSLGRKATHDTSLRRLQSIFRNNASTNYGSRVNNAKILEESGAAHIMPALAGQHLNSWLPRGMAKYSMGAAAGAALGTGAALNPATLALLPFISPRIMGEAGMAAGTAARQVGKSAKRLGVGKEAIIRALIAGKANESLKALQ